MPLREQTKEPATDGRADGDVELPLFALPLATSGDEIIK